MLRSQRCMHTYAHQYTQIYMQTVTSKHQDTYAPTKADFVHGHTVLTYRHTYIHTYIHMWCTSSCMVYCHRHACVYTRTHIMLTLMDTHRPNVPVTMCLSSSQSKYVAVTS